MNGAKIQHIPIQALQGKGGRHPWVATLNGTIILDRVENMTRRRWEFEMM